MNIIGRRLGWLFSTYLCLLISLFQLYVHTDNRNQVFLNSKQTDNGDAWNLAITCLYLFFSLNVWHNWENYAYFADHVKMWWTHYIPKYIYHFMSGYTAYVAWGKVAVVKLSLWQPTHILRACKLLQSQVFLVEQLTMHMNINVWKYWYGATEPKPYLWSGVGMLIKSWRGLRK